MYNESVMKRFAEVKYAGGIRGSSATGRAGDSDCGDLVKIYILVNEFGRIQTAKFKAYGKISTIVASDIACQLIEKKTLDMALEVSAKDILDEMGKIPENRIYSASLAEEAIKNAVEDFYKKQDKLDDGE